MPGKSAGRGRLLHIQGERTDGGAPAPVGRSGLVRTRVSVEAAAPDLVRGRKAPARLCPHPEGADASPTAQSLHDPPLTPRALLVVSNATGRSLWSFNVRGSRAGTWGRDILEGVIPPAGSATWEVRPGVYHLRAETGDGHRLHHFGLELKSGQLARWIIEEED